MRLPGDEVAPPLDLLHQALVVGEQGLRVAVAVIQHRVLAIELRAGLLDLDLELLGVGVLMERRGLLDGEQQVVEELSGKPNRAEIIPALLPPAVVSLNRPLLAQIKRDTDMLAG